MKIFCLFSLSALCMITALRGQSSLDNPTLEQLLNTDKIEISFSCRRDVDKQQVNMESWLNMVKAVDTLVDACYTYPHEKDAELFEEVCETIRYIRNELSSAHACGFYRQIVVGGQTVQSKEEIIHDGASYILINTLDSAQTDQLLQLQNKQWWAKDRTRQELDTLLENSLYFVLIDNNTQKIIGFIRAVTDYIRYAAIFDVMIDEKYQGMGLGKLLVKAMQENPRIAKIPLVELHCLDDKVAFYEKCGFEKSFENLVPMRVKRK